MKISFFHSMGPLSGAKLCIESVSLCDNITHSLKLQNASIFWDVKKDLLVQQVLKSPDFTQDVSIATEAS